MEKLKGLMGVALVLLFVPLVASCGDGDSKQDADSDVSETSEPVMDLDVTGDETMTDPVVDQDVTGDELATDTIADVEADNPPVTVDEAAWAWASNPSASHDADTSYSYNSSGSTAAIHVEYVSTGTYQVKFPGAYLETAGGNVQVVSYGATTRCGVTNWSKVSTADLQVTVACHDMAGALADSRFVASWVARTGLDTAAPAAYLWYDGATVDAFYSWNSSGGTNSVAKDATGKYTATLAGLGTLPRGGTVQVTAYGGSSAYCKIRNWGPDGSDLKVALACFTSAGVATDSNFSLVFSTTDAAGGDSGGYAWANEASSASYTPDTEYQYIAIGGTPSSNPATITRSEAGAYAATFPGLTDSGKSLALVTAYTDDSNWCNIADWGTGVVNVLCFTATGTAVDSRYVVDFSTVP